MATREALPVERTLQPEPREGQAGPVGCVNAHVRIRAGALTNQRPYRASGPVQETGEVIRITE